MSPLHDARRCLLGEGPLWHPERGQLFWFDILGRRMLSHEGGEEREWTFAERVSAAGWIDRDHLLIASQTGLWQFSISTGAQTRLVEMEADIPGTRSNDGRADPQGGFWIGTMGLQAEPGAGAIYRYHRGELRRLFAAVSIPNAICFAPDGTSACFADTAEQRILRVALDAQGWPVGAPQTFVDLAPEGLFPDGAVFDAEGCLWNAQWGAGRVARYRPDGRFDRALDLPATLTTCPAFGGPDLATLYVTSASVALPRPDALQGCVFALTPSVRGLPEHRVRL